MVKIFRIYFTTCVELYVKYYDKVVLLRTVEDERTSILRRAVGISGAVPGATAPRLLPPL